MHVIPKAILCSVVKYASEDAHRRVDDFDAWDIEPFTALTHAS